MWVRKQEISCLLGMALLTTLLFCSFGCLFSTALCVVEVMKCFHHISPQQTLTSAWWGQAPGGKGATWHPLGCVTAAGPSLCAPAEGTWELWGWTGKNPWMLGRATCFVNDFDLNRVNFQKNWTSEPMLCLSPQGSVSPSCTFQSLCIAPKMGEEHSFRGGITMENAGLLHIMAMEAIKELQKAMRDILLEVLFSIKHFLMSPSGR